MLLFLSRAFFAGAGERRILLPPTSPRSTEDSLRIRPQLRPTFARRRRADYRNRNSGERPVPRRRAPAPLRVVLAGAGERTTLPPPTSPRSSDDSLRIRAQLRPAFSRRRRYYYRKRNSVEKPVRRRKALAPVRVVFAGAGGCKRASAPIRPRSSKKSVPLMSQLRLTFACRSRDYYR